MEFILDALGWRFASEGKKAEPPLPCFKVLGVVMDMSHSSTGKLVVSNKPERIDDLVRTMGNILDKGYLPGSAAASLHGQLNFAQGQYYGCTLKPGMVFLQKVLRNGWHSDYQQELATVVCYIVAALRTSPPRQVCSTDDTSAHLVWLSLTVLVNSGWFRKYRCRHSWFNIGLIVAPSSLSCFWSCGLH